jgi:hypothetical protein
MSTGSTLLVGWPFGLVLVSAVGASLATDLVVALDFFAARPEGSSEVSTFRFGGIEEYEIAVLGALDNARRVTEEHVRNLVKAAMLANIVAKDHGHG